MVAIAPNEAGTFVSSGFCCRRGKKTTASLLPGLGRARAYWPAAQPIRALLPLCAGWATPTHCLASRVRVAQGRTRGFFARGNAGLGRGFPERCGSFASGRRSGRGGAGPAENTRSAAFDPSLYFGAALLPFRGSRASLGSLLPPNLLFLGGDRQAFNWEGWTCACMQVQDCPIRQIFGERVGGWQFHFLSLLCA